MPSTETPTLTPVRKAQPPGHGHCPSAWLQPVAGHEAQPCGPNLEYDNEHAVLQSLLTPKVQVQYGSFTAEPEPPDWSAIERQARALSQRTRDITVLVALTRARTHRAGAEGLREGLSIVHALLHLWPGHIHPQTHPQTGVAGGDGEHEAELDPDGPLVRANALAALADPQGLLADIRGVAISTSAAAPLTVKDVERALSPVKSAYSSGGPEPQAVRLQLMQLRHRCDERLQALIDSAQLAQGIAHWCQAHLQQDAPDLTGLSQLLGHVCNYRDTPDKVQAEAVEDGGVQVHTQTGQDSSQGASHSAAHPVFALDLNLQPQTALPDGQQAMQLQGHMQAGLQTHTLADIPAQREHIRALLGQVIGWIEHHEPSSPVSIVLRQAQHLWGKRYAEIIAAVPPELLAQWDAQFSQGEGGA